jgi:ABC-type transporter Mla maintaining outer membrane lipid asymmetry ATPase subunit MlaF
MGRQLMPSTTQPPERQNRLLPESKRWPLDEGKPVIELIGVHKAFGANNVLNGLSLKILPGKSTVIVGRSGSGKSVLLKLMMGLLRPDSGKVVLFGRDVDELSDLELILLRKRMSMLFQNYALLDSLSVEENVGFTLLENTNMPRKEIMGLVNELLKTLGLDGFGKSLPAELSGGMRKRVSLARALIANPEVVLFDEPTTGLDPIMIEKVDEMIRLAKESYQITSAIISHDMASTKRLADRVAFLHKGTIISEGTYQEFLASDLPPVRAFHEGSRTSRLARISGGSVLEDASEGVVPEETAVVELVDLHKKFGSHHVLKGVNLKIYPGRITVLIGGSGSGKSVIVKHIMGLFKPTSGEVRVFGQDIVPLGDRALHEVRSRFGMLFQHAALLDWLSVAGNIAFPLEERTNTPKKQIRAQVDEMLERLHIADLRDRMPGEISEGQKKRVGLARAIIMKPEIMIYDEPTTGQDPIRSKDVDDMIQQAQREFDITSIVISHDMASTFRIADTVALLQHGEIAAYGSPEELRASKDEYVQRFIYAGQVD